MNNKRKGKRKGKKKRKKKKKKRQNQALPLNNERLRNVFVSII